MPGIRVGRVAPTSVSWAASNLAVQPQPLAASGNVFSGMAGTGATTTDSSSGGPLPGTGYVRRTAGSAPPAIGATADILLHGDTTWVAGSGALISGAIIVSPGAVYTTSLYVRCSRAVSVRLQNQPIKGGAGGSVSANGTAADVALTANTWTRLSLVGTVVLDAQALRVDVDAGSGAGITWVAGDTLDVACVQIDEGARLLPWTPARRV